MFGVRCSVFMKAQNDWIRAECSTCHNSQRGKTNITAELLELVMYDHMYACNIIITLII